MPRRPLAFAVLLALWFVPGATAHVHIVSHQTRYDGLTIKSPPCGMPASVSARGEIVHTFRAGETITLDYNEYIPHPGHFRVSFDVDGEDDFVDPAGYDDLYTNDTVLLDGFAAHVQSGEGGIRSVEVALPDVECDNCTLQLAQIMTDKPPYEPATDDLYYNCLDIVLVADEDEDGARDAEDNCVDVPNPDQRDTNLDGYGNLCDADLNNDGAVDFLDLGLLKAVFFTDNADADLNGDASVDFLDLGLMKSQFFQPPGPSGLACAGTIPCP